MKTADAKAPKFDSKWWVANKAKAADADNAFAKALKAYEDEKKKFLADTTSASGVKTDGVVAALKKVKLEAGKKKADPKLGALQKETKEGLLNYEKRCDTMLKDIDRLEASPLMRMTSLELVKAVPQFEAICKKEFILENYKFVAFMVNNTKKELRWYTVFIKENSPTQINISDKLRAEFDVIAEAVAREPSRDTPATWSKAPWDAALGQVRGMLDAGVVPRFRAIATGQQLKAKLP